MPLERKRPGDTRRAYAEELAKGFNGATDRQRWRATVAGTRVKPEVNFKSTGSMVCITYDVASDSFTVTYSRVGVAFGDFMSSTFRSLSQVLAALKATGFEFPSPVDDSAVLRIEYSPKTKVATIAIAQHGDDWPEADPIPFKVPERSEENIANLLDPT